MFILILPPPKPGNGPPVGKPAGTPAPPGKLNAPPPPGMLLNPPPAVPPSKVVAFTVAIDLAPKATYDAAKAPPII
jgi:hypothetical protein